MSNDERDIEEHDETKARRVSVRVPTYANPAEEKQDGDVLRHIVNLLATAQEKAENAGSIPRHDYDQLVAQIEDARRHMKFPELDIVSGEPLEMLQVYVR